MKKFKKIRKKSIAAIVLAISMMASLAGCKDKDDDSDDATTTSTSMSTEITTEDANNQNQPNVQLPDVDPDEEDPSTPEAKKEQQRFQEYLDEIFLEGVTSDTITMHYSVAYPENYGITDYEVTYGDVDLSPEGMAKEKQELEDDIAVLEGFDRDLLTIDQRFTYDILKKSADTNLESYNFDHMYEPFAYTSGLQTNFPITLAEYQFYSERDIQDYIKLLELYPDYVQVWLDYEREKSDMGLFMNSHNAEEVIRQCTEFSETPEENVLIATFESRIDAFEGLTAEQKEEYKKQNHDAVVNCIIPAYDNIISTFNELKDTGVNDLGLAHLENGKEYYKYLIKSKVGTDRPPEKIIELLDKEIEKVMDKLMSTVYSDMNAYQGYMDEYESFYQGLDNRETVDYFQEAFDAEFPDIPDIDFSITPVHESLEGSVSPAFYMTPPLDKYDENFIHINEGSDSSGALWSTLAHEGVPGHMYQFVYFLSSDPEPVRTLLNFNGYSEGWAEYIENMSFKYYDGYSNPIYADIEELNAKINILVSARVEIGVNYEGWDLDATKQYLNDNGFNGEAAQDLMDYVIAEPANYQMYCTGWLEMEQLKRYSKKMLGDEFDAKEFHKAILDAGPCQFSLLKEQIDKYIVRTLND